jgi:glycerol-3-phosphate dehydrogenase
VVALLDDARRAAEEHGVEFSLYTYHRVKRDGTGLEIYPAEGEKKEFARTVQPAAIVNATGAWVDHTLRQLESSTPRRIGGTKGTHLLTYQSRLRDALQGRGVYAQADDGRPVFILPFGAAVLVGTTDIPYDGDPARATASAEELQYLVSLVNTVIPSASLSREDIHLHYAGVRPLPFAAGKKPGAISRGHWLDKHSDGPPPLYSIIGGKLTTCRSLAQEAAAQILAHLDRPVVANSAERALPGGEEYPADSQSLEDRQQHLATGLGISLDSVRRAWILVGAKAEDVLTANPSSSQDLLCGTDLPVSVAQWSIEHEWATRLEDLVERRLMLLYDQQLSIDCLNQLAVLLVEAGHLSSDGVASAVQKTKQRLEDHFGLVLQPAVG